MDTEISVKWPAARLLGPDVEYEDALEFIRRTDPAFVGEGFTNNHAFDKQLRSLIGLRDPFSDPSTNMTDHWRHQEIWIEEWGFIRLNHLSSHWVECAYIGGPNGPVSPIGNVRLAKNFGKWPSVEEIDEDLNTLTIFPWLEFKLSVWGRTEESDEGLPSHTWTLDKGSWCQDVPERLPIQEEDPALKFLLGMNNPMREQTWTINQIQHIWGDKIKETRARVEARLEEPSDA